MAFNYWFYPPTSEAFEKPYEDEMVWEYLRGREKRTEGASEPDPGPEREDDNKVNGKRKRREDGSEKRKKAKR